MNVLLFGHTSSTHALAWKLINSPAIHELIVAPGNGGTSLFAASAALATDDHQAVASFVLNESIDLVIVDSDSSASGLPDEMHALSVPVFGSSLGAHRLHQSRCSAREWLHQAGLPTPRGRVCASRLEAEKYLAAMQGPLVVISDQADGPTLVCADHAAAQRAVAHCFDNDACGVIIEDYVLGPVVTASLLTDGQVGVAVPPVRLYTTDQISYSTINGAQSGTTPVWQRLDQHLQRVVRQPLLKAFEASGEQVCGWIGATCVLGQRGPLLQTVHLIPSGFELAASLPRLQSDLLPLLLGAAQGNLAQVDPPRWSRQAVIAVGLLQPNATPIGIETIQRAITDFEPGTLTFQHAPSIAVPNRYVPRSERYAKARSMVAPMFSSTRTRAASSDDPVLAIVAAAAPDQRSARERVYGELRRSGLPSTLYSDDVGAGEL